MPSFDFVHDVPFSVSFVHRLRMTDDVFGTDGDALTQLIAASEGQIPRVQFWIDEHVASANPQLTQRIHSFCRRHADSLQLIGNLQVVPGGEDVKNNVHLIESMLRCFHHADLDRRSYVVVIGGGAVLDAVGFAAAIAHRGIRLIRLPTTTLAQADSGIGVKNSINLFGKKNWVGTFAVPWGIINDKALLQTLSDRDFACGFSEAVKVALLKDGTFFGHICDSAEAIPQRADVCWPIIADSARWHLKHITQGGDPFEMLEARPLDFGHWSAHKLETMSNFELRHGEAVAIGVAIDSVYSSLAHGLPASDADNISNCLNTLGLLVNHSALNNTEELFNGMEEFRQHLGGRLTLTMLNAVGKPLDVHQINHDLMRQAIATIVERITKTVQHDS